MNDLTSYKPIAEAVTLLLYPHAEVVIHNLKSGCIEAIFNNFSKRAVGDESLLDETDDSMDLFPPYYKINYDGRKMKSVTAVLRNSRGKRIGFMCINLDISKWEEMQHFILGMIQPGIEKPEVLFKNDWREKINQYVTSYLQQQGLRLEALDRGEKKKLLLALHKEGAFNTKNGASYVADVLQISRATVYKYLKD